MKYNPIFLLAAVILPMGSCYAQWKNSLGINVVPIIANSFEVISEFSPHPGYSFSINAGVTINTGHVGLVDHKVYDGITDRKTSGEFVKAGSRIYIGSLGGQERRGNFFVGLQAIISRYRQSALSEPIDGGNNGVGQWPVSAKGTVVSPSLTLGFTRKIGKKLALDWGVQKSLPPKRKNFYGQEIRNYQPGMGSGQSDPFIGYLQGILTVKYRL